MSVLHDYLRHFSFQSTNRVFFDIDALYKFMFYLLYLLYHNTYASQTPPLITVTKQVCFKFQHCLDRMEFIMPHSLT